MYVSDEPDDEPFDESLSNSDPAPQPLDPNRERKPTRTSTGKGPYKRGGERGPEVNGYSGANFTDELKAQYCALIAKDAAKTQAAIDLGVHPATVRKHLKSDPAFKAAVDDALAQFRDRLGKQAVKMAVDGIVKPVYQRGVRVDKNGENREYAPSVLIRMLERYDPEYRPKSEVTNTNLNLELPAADIESLTPEQRAKIRELLATNPQEQDEP